MFSAKISSFTSSLRVRFTALYLALLFLTLSLFCMILYQVFVRNHEKEFDIALYNHAVDVGQSMSVDFFGVLRANNIGNNEKIFPFSLGRSLVQVVSPDGQIVAQSNNLGGASLPLNTNDWDGVFQNGSAFRTLTSHDLKDVPNLQNGTKYRLITYFVRRGKPNFILQIAVPMAFLVQETSSLLLFFIVGIPSTLLVAGLGGVFLANKAFEPVRGIIRKAAKLSPHNLSERLPEPGSQDEIQQLTVTLNRMLGRIEKAFESHENFIADASHQLKTPLAILRGELDVFRSKPRTASEMNDFVESAAQELMHMSRLLDDLLLLTKVDAGAGSFMMRKIRLDEILLETIARIEILAKQKNKAIRLDLVDNTAGESEEDFVVNGDSDLLQSMFRNLIDNAIKYSPPSTAIEVKVINDASRVLIQIKDFGDPIPPELTERLFQRYERGNILKNTAAGSGLGLTIARRIAELHGGNISILQDNPPGKSFQVEMKKN